MGLGRMYFRTCDVCREESRLCPTSQDAMTQARRDGWARRLTAIPEEGSTAGVRYMVDRVSRCDLCPACSKKHPVATGARKLAIRVRHEDQTRRYTSYLGVVTVASARAAVDKMRMAAVDCVLETSDGRERWDGSAWVSLEAAS